jgi:hypothetical protein
MAVQEVLESGEIGEPSKVATERTLAQFLERQLAERFRVQLCD